MTSHTPGPWQYYADLPSAEPNWHIVTNESRTRVVANVHIEPRNTMDEANAKLIAAAPALLAALKAALPHLSKYAASINMMGGAENGPEPACALVRAAIAKAEA